MRLSYTTLASILSTNAPAPLRTSLNIAAVRMDMRRLHVKRETCVAFTVGAFEMDRVELAPGVTPERCPHCPDDPHCLHRAAALLASARRCTVKLDQ